MTEAVQEEQLDRKDIKILAYKQANQELQEKVADLQVDVAFLSDQLRKTTEKVQELENAVTEPKKEEPSDDTDDVS